MGSLYETSYPTHLVSVIERIFDSAPVLNPGQLTKNFHVREFYSGSTPVPEHLMGNLRRLAQNLQVLRDYLDLPITINSGYRTPDHNASIGGARNSQHLVAKAADIHVAGMTPSQVYCAVLRLIGAGRMEEGGLGIYTGHVHYDVRGAKARWTGGGASAPSCSH